MIIVFCVMPVADANPTLLLGALLPNGSLKCLRFFFTQPFTFFFVVFQHVAVFFLSATTMFFGHLTECLARPCEDYSSWTTSWPHRLQAHFMGYVPQITAWFIIMYSFHQVALSQATITTSAGEVKTVQMPNFVYGIVYGELVVFWSFGIIQLVFTLLSPKMYPYGELCYQIMSLVSKGLLGLILIVNVLMLSRFEDIYNN